MGSDKEKYEDNSKGSILILICLLIIVVLGIATKACSQKEEELGNRTIDYVSNTINVEKMYGEN